MTKQAASHTVPEAPELIAARSLAAKRRRDQEHYEAYHDSLKEQVERAEKSLATASKRWREEDAAAAKAHEQGSYAAVTPHVARAEFREKIAAELADLRAKLGEGLSYEKQIEFRNREHNRRDLLSSSERQLAELEAQHVNAAALAAAPELTDTLRELAEELTVAGPTTHAGVTVTRTPEGVVTFTVAVKAVEAAAAIEADTPIARLRARVNSKSRPSNAEAQ